MSLKDYLNYLKSLIKTTIKLLLAVILFTSLTTNIVAQDQINVSKSTVDTSKFVMKKSPWGAVLRSAVVPGFGQFYNESYWKIPVIWGVLGYLGYQWNSLNKSYKNYRLLYDQSKSDANPNGNSIYLTYREFYHDQRDLFAIYIGLTYFLNLVDAYVDAQLFDFDVNEDQFGPKMQMTLKIKF